MKRPDNWFPSWVPYPAPDLNGGKCMTEGSIVIRLPESLVDRETDLADPLEVLWYIQDQAQVWYDHVTHPMEVERVCAWAFMNEVNRICRPFNGMFEGAGRHFWQVDYFPTVKSTMKFIPLGETKRAKRVKKPKPTVEHEDVDAKWEQEVNERREYE